MAKTGGMVSVFILFYFYIWNSRVCENVLFYKSGIAYLQIDIFH